MDDDSKVVWLRSDEVLLRQAHPAQMKGLVPSSQVFIPTADHSYTLSTRRQRFGAKRAYDDHIASDLQSAGTWGVSVSELSSQDLDAFDDSAKDGMPECHVSIPFGHYESPSATKRTHKMQARALKVFAVSRGCLYRP